MAHPIIMPSFPLPLGLISSVYTVMVLGFFVTDASRVSDKIYSNLQSNHFCSRRLNATHQMGCSSELGGNSGVLWVVETQYDLDHILKVGITPPYIALMSREYYTRENLLAFKDNTDRVAGVILTDLKSSHSSKLSTPYSPEDICPNRNFGLYFNDTQYQNCKQNAWLKESQISGLLYQDIPYPIFYINDKKSIDDLTSCFNSNNLARSSSKREQDHYPLCSVQLDSFMLAASNTKACLNSHSLVDELLQTSGIRCSTVENQNIFGYLKPTRGPVSQTTDGKYVIPSTVEPQSVVLVIAKLSSLSMFTDLSPGADSTISSIVTLLAIAEALGKIKDEPQVLKSSRNVAFALLDSEPFDYTGSSRMVFNMLENTFPNRMFKQKVKNKSDQGIVETVQNINLTSIDYIINLDQLAYYPNKDKIYLHSDPNEKNENKLKSLRSTLEQMAKITEVNYERDDNSLPLPPAPVQEFIRSSRKLKSDHELLGVVLSNYGRTFNNLFYHSVLDDTTNIFQSTLEKQVAHLTKVANFLAKSIYELAFNTQKSDNVQVDSSTINSLLSCYLVDANCGLFTKVWQARQNLPEGPVQTYNDPTRQSDDMNGAITTHLLSYYLGYKHTELNISQCYIENENSTIFNYQYINGKETPAQDINSGLCIASQVFNTRADSPAYEFTEYGLKINTNYPAWSISLNSIRNPVRIYLQPSLVHEWSMFFLGLVITIMSLLVVQHLKDELSKMNIVTST